MDKETSYNGSVRHVEWRFTYYARGLGLFGVAGETCLFKQFKHSVEFLGETAYHVGQLVEGDCGCFHFSAVLYCLRK